MKRHFGLIVILIIASISMAIFTNHRYEYFEDEVTSYGVANNGQYRVFVFGYELDQEVSDLLDQYIFGSTLGETLGKLKSLLVDVKANGIKQSKFYDAACTYQGQEEKIVWRDADYFRDYLTIQKGEQFSVWKTYIAAIRDVHPPLYFMILNIICSFTPNVFSGWSAFTINWFSIIGISILLYYLAKKYYVDEKGALLVVLYYVLSRGGISTAYLFRPYALLTLFVVAFVLIHLYLQKHDWIITRRMRWLLGTVTVLGYLTQYYFLFVAVTVFAVSVIEIARHGSKSSQKRYVCTFLWSALTGLILWPFSVKHIFMSSRGIEALGAVVDNSKGKQLFDFVEIILKDMLIGNGVMIIVLLSICIFFSVYNKLIILKGLEYKWILCGMVIFIYFILAGTISPYATSRYMMCVYPLIALVCVFILLKGMEMIPQRNYQSGLMFLTVIAIIVWGVFQQPDDHYQMDDQDRQELMQVQADGLDCVYIYRSWNEYVSSIPEFMNYRKTLLLSGEQLEILKEDSTVSEDDKIVVYLSKYEDETIDDILETIGYDSYEEIAQKSWATVYVMEK